MKITFVSFTNSRGGAAKATVRMRNLANKLGFEPDLVSIEGQRNKVPFYFKAMHYIAWITSHIITKLQKQERDTKSSLNLFGSQYIKNNIKKANLLHVHWINNETLNIKDFPLLSNKSVITLHDEWFYCGAEHHALDDKSYNRVVNGYTKTNKNVKGVDINRLVWQRKKKYYPNLNNVIFTVPSTWMKSRAEKSYLLRNNDIRVLPNPINTDVFKCDKTDFSFDEIMPEDFIITFGAIDGGASEIKGFDLLTEAIQLFSQSIDSLENIKIIIFGGKEKKLGSMFGVKTFELGHISSEVELAKIYSVSSVTVVPSRVESFGQVAAESLSCETPVIAFNYSGLTDIIQHKQSGYLAEPFKAKSLADGILWLYSLSDTERKYLGAVGRAHVLESFCEQIVGERLISLYKELGPR